MELAKKMYSDMVRVEMMDKMFWEVQRQGRISFYLTSAGEEATTVASAAALSPLDLVFPQVYKNKNKNYLCCNYFFVFHF